MTPARLIPLPDGPYEVTGALCRSGRSANKPSCDGSHARTGWTKRDA
jgi:CDGSH-type Zn-finger protein